MYRINLYQEHFEQASRARRRVGATAVLSMLTGLGLLAAILILINGWILRDRNRFLETEIRRLSSEVQTRQGGPQERVASQLVQLRRTRLLWSPKLSAVARSIGPSLRLLEITAHSPSKGQPAQIQMVGVNRSARTAGVVEFLEALREDPQVRRDLPRVILEQLEEDGSGRFQITCENAGATP